VTPDRRSPLARLVAALLARLRPAGTVLPALDENGFAAPTAVLAYAHAPAIEDEALFLMSCEVPEPEWEPDAYREVLLRRAAAYDRMYEPQDEALGGQARGQIALTAFQAARALFEWDREHPEHVAGPIWPTSPMWDAAGGIHAYLHQEARAFFTTRHQAEQQH
jgi:hypothetical protein